MNSSPIIFFLLPRLPSVEMKDVGGGELSNILLINKIAKKNKVILFPMISSFNEYKFSKNVKVYKPNYNFKGRVGYFMQKYLFYYKFIYKLAIKYKPKKIIATRSTINSGYKIKKNFKCEFEIIVRAYEDFINVKKFDPYSKSSNFRKIERLLFGRKIFEIYKSVDRIITNSKFMSQAIQRDLGFKINSLVIYPEINLPKSNPRFETVRKIGFINRGEKKGYKIIIKLSKQNPSFQFLIFGDKLNVYQKNIINMGYFTNRSLIFDQIDVVLVPSIWNEPYGRIASEAIWSGIMVLASNKGGLKEAVTDNFFIVESTYVKEWNIKLNKLVNKKNLINSKILKAQSKLAHYNYDYS